MVNMCAFLKPRKWPINQLNCLRNSAVPESAGAKAGRLRRNSAKYSFLLFLNIQKKHSHHGQTFHIQLFLSALFK